MNPTQDIPQRAAREQPQGKPASGIAAVPPEKQPGENPAPEAVPADLANLALAAGLLLSAFLIFWMGLYLSNHVALRTLVASFGTFALVWVLHRLRVFQRPHGGLIAAGSVALFAAALPFAERGFQRLDHAAKTGLAGEPAKPDAETADTLPVPTRQKMPAPPESPAPSAPTPPPEEPVRELVAPAPDANAKQIVRMIQDAQVAIGGHKYHIGAGREFLFRRIEDGTVTFQAGEQEVTIDSALVKIGGKSKETPDEIRKLAEVEMARRYPAVGVSHSPENELYLERIRELRVEMPSLFNDPHWPLTIGEQLAGQEGWKRADQPSDETAPPMQKDLPPADEPAAPEPSGLPGPSDSPIPRIPSNVPQEAPK